MSWKRPRPLTKILALAYLASASLSTKKKKCSNNDTRHYWMMGLACGLALGIGVPAAMFTEHHPFVEADGDVGRIGGNRKGRPGCYVPADPFKNPYSTTVNDPGFNFTLSNLVSML